MPRIYPQDGEYRQDYPNGSTAIRLALWGGIKRLHNVPRLPQTNTYKSLWENHRWITSRWVDDEFVGFMLHHHNITLLDEPIEPIELCTFCPDESESGEMFHPDSNFLLCFDRGMGGWYLLTI